jgi:hypothetical protein
VSASDPAVSPESRAVMRRVGWRINVMLIIQTVVNVAAVKLLPHF